MTLSATITDEIDRRWASAGDSVAVRERMAPIAFGQLLAWSQAITRLLEPAVRKTGQLVALVMPNSAGFVAAFFGAARAGAVVAPLSVRAPKVELATALTALDPVAVITSLSAVEEIGVALAALRPAPALIGLSPPDGVHLLQSPQHRGRALPTDESPPLLLLTTSGSTGDPKRVVRTHAALLAELAALRRALKADEGDRFLGVMPFSHVNGLVRTMMTSMSVGAELHPMEEFSRRAALDILARQRITIVGGVPQLFILLARTLLRESIDLGALRLVFSSSAPLLPDDNREFHRRYGLYVRQLYGSTETGSIAFNDDADPATSLETVGRALDGVRLELVDEHGRPVASSQEGEVVVSSPFAARQYLDDPAATTIAFRNGAYHTGDLGTLDQSRRLTLTGRRHFVINRGGFKVNPHEVEAALRTHAKVEDVVVFGIPSRHGDEIVACVIVAKDACTPEEVLEHCQARLADFKIPSRIEFRSTLPRSETGKVLRAHLGR
jgi:long-chain acyl-CoA synthetase